MVLADHVVPLGGGDHDDPVVGSQREVRRAHKVPDVLYEDHIVSAEIHLGQGFLDQVGVQVAFVAGVAVDGLQPGLLESAVVVGSGDVPCDGADADAFGPELLGQLDYERGLSCADGAHEVHRLDLVALQEAIVLVGYLVVFLENVDFHSRLDYVHERCKGVMCI